MLGEWSTTANYCATRASWTKIVWVAHRSGHYVDFQITLGVSSGKVVMVTMQKSDPRREIQLHPEDCQLFDVRTHVEPDGSLGADVELDCQGGDGARVTAAIHAESCPP